MNGLVLTALTNGRPGGFVVQAMLDGRPIHGDECNVHKAADRTDFRRALIEKNRDLDAEEIDEQLLRLSAEHRKREEEDAAAPKKSQATTLVEIAAAGELWHTAADDAYATVKVGEHLENWPVRSKGFRRWLSRQYYLMEGRAAGAQAVQDAMNVVEGAAVFQGAERPVYTRVGEHEGAIYLDLGGADWQAVEITPAGWRVVVNPPVRFRRAKAMMPLPVPIAGGSLDELRGLVNVGDEDWPLVAGWQLAAVRSRGPYPVLCLSGEQGSAKSTTARVLRSLIDPNGALLRAEPRDPRDLMIAGSNAWVVALDNLSHVPAWLSDALCRMSTGGGFSTRQLYEDAEEMIFDAMRPVILTGIEELATRGDLLDRSLLVNLPNIPDERRRQEADFWEEFAQRQPRILGALLTAVSAALRNLPSTRLDRLPRMADFATWATAGEGALGLSTGAFMAAYAGNREEANELAIETSPVGKAIMDLMGSTDSFNGTATELLCELNKRVDENTRKAKVWPKTANVLGGIVKRLAPNLRAAGISVVHTPSGRGKGKRRGILLGRVPQSVVPVVPTVPTPGIHEGSGASGANSGGKGDDAGTAEPIGASPGTTGDDGDDELQPRSNEGGTREEIPGRPEDWGEV